MNRLLFGTTLALTTTLACGGDDSTIPNPDDSGGGGQDTSLADSANAVDSSPSPDSGGSDAATFNVKGVPGLALWLDGSKDLTVSSGRVTKWHDQSGNNNDAISPSFAGVNPTQVASSINGQPGVHFTATVLAADGGASNYGNIMQISDSATLEWGAGDFLIEAVALYDNTTHNGNPAEQAIGAGTFYSKQQYTALGVSPWDVTTGAALYGNVFSLSAPTTGFSGYTNQANFIASATTGYNDGKGHIFAVQRVGTTLSLRVNGVQTDSKSIGSVDLDQTSDGGISRIGARIGASGDANMYRLDGDIDEMIAVKGTLSPSDLAGIEGYLKARYGL